MCVCCAVFLQSARTDPGTARDEEPPYSLVLNRRRMRRSCYYEQQQQKQRRERLRASHDELLYTTRARRDQPEGRIREC